MLQCSIVNNSVMNCMSNSCRNYLGESNTIICGKIEL